VGRLEKPCADGDREACHRMADAFRFSEHASDLPRDEARGLELERRACALGQVDACFEVACAADAAGHASNGKERARAIRRLTQRCDLGDGGACERLADLFEVECRVPDELQDERQARDLRRRGCELGEAMACYLFGQSLQNKLRTYYLRRACELQMTPACNELR
jgi:TPR repeat protein